MDKPTDKQLTPAQQKRRDERLAAMQTPVAEAPKDEAPVKAISLNVALGVGANVRFGAKDYDLPPLPLKQQDRASELLYAVDEIFSTHALATLDGGEFGVSRTTALLNRFRAAARAADVDAPDLSEGEVATALAAKSFPVSEEDAEAMGAFALFALRLGHPEITEEEVDASLSVPTFLHLLRCFFHVNSGVTARFVTPG